jgi:hypothetical protein
VPPSHPHRYPRKCSPRRRGKIRNERVQNTPNSRTDHTYSQTTRQWHCGKPRSLLDQLSLNKTVTINEKGDLYECR